MKQQLFRLKHQGKISGVSAGLAEYFNVDVTLIRIAFLASVFLNGIGIIAYIVLWIALPIRVQNPSDYSALLPTTTNETTFSRNGAYIGGISLILLGIYFLLENFFPELDFENFMPLILCIIGASLVYSAISTNTVATNSVMPFTTSENTYPSSDSVIVVEKQENSNEIK